eukprot:TRINITY_DN11006_c0_g1_i1.p1 TRINITY_DN11006_c0_g1~~TRINITY_DN11006_c0_g1_i1.p1  ORF type:complete len:352 (+),score=64.40 TRINITY_DN11006_c0_g1_i1:30-1085(+)
MVYGGVKSVFSAVDSLRAAPYSSDLSATREPCQFFQKAGWCKWGDNCKHAHASSPADAARLNGEDGIQIGKDGGPELCQFFARSGWCKWGDQCKHLHGQDELAFMNSSGGESPLPPLDPPVPGSLRISQETCQFFAREGWCKWGDKCHHIHDRTSPPTSSLQEVSSRLGGSSLSSLSGSVRAVAAALGGGRSEKDRSTGEVCQFFAREGWCKWGDKCHHLHTASPSAEWKDAAPWRAGASSVEALSARIGGAAKEVPGNLREAGGSGEVCQFFAKSGWCKWGDKCQHIHSGSSGSAAARPIGAGSDSLEATFASLLGSPESLAPAKEPCRFFAKAGWCKWGEECRNPHIQG